MSVTRWQPWQELETLSRQVDQLFNSVIPSVHNSVPLGRQTWTPAVELQGDKAEFVLRAELPGIAADDLDIQISRNAVVISGEYRSEQTADQKGLLHSEFRYGKFQRVISLPAAVVNDRATAEFQGGVLTLTLPRLDAVQPQVVKVKLGEATPQPVTPATTQAVAPADTIASSQKAAEPETDDVWAA